MTDQSVVVILSEQARHHTLSRLTTLAGDTGCRKCAEAADAHRYVRPIERVIEDVVALTNCDDREAIRKALLP